MQGQIHLTTELVQAVRDAADVVDIAHELTNLKKKGRRYEALCPFHKEKSPSFNLDPDLNLYHCFGCGVGGDAIDLHMRASGDDFSAAIEALAQRYAIPLPTGGGGALGPPRKDLTSVMEAAQRFFQQQLASSGAARAYLERRKIPTELQHSYGLGFAPDDWRRLLAALSQRFDIDTLIEAGLIAHSEKSDSHYDRFRNRLMFPIHSVSGKLVGFGGRTMGDDKAKYINSAETGLFHKGQLLYGLYQAKRTIRDSGRLVLTEGYFDVIGAAASGVGEAVAAMGTALTPEQCQLMARYGDRVVLGYDGDAAGSAAARKAIPLLLAAGLGVSRAGFPEGHDPDSMRLEMGPKAVVEAVDSASDAVLEELERLAPEPGDRDPRSQAEAADAVRELVRPIRHRIVRDGYLRRAAQLIGLPEDVLMRRGGGDLFATQREPAGLVRSEEEKAIGLLLKSSSPPELEQLPEANSFLDPAWRNIFLAWRDIYSSGRRAPTGREVISRLSDQGVALDRATRLLLEEAVPEGGENLLETLGMLQSRWLKRRLAEIQPEIRQAEQQGDATRLGELLEEKTKLSRHRHPQMTGRLWTQGGGL